MAGLEDMEHGDYFYPAIKVVYGMSPAGYEPDQFGTTTTPPGFSGMTATAVFVILGEQKKDINGPAFACNNSAFLRADKSSADYAC
ncbi:MAG: hypothetical protein GF350_05170 [Chitinivibrionales bacterium]|nr:hypothetical protein [Chitinivibrionales bacterium]